ncbi:MAG: DUF1289 domain-containing protein [Roseicyclus sp.]|nr:DUF1289 domain-containing protein [Roseicyclus sp.]
MAHDLWNRDEIQSPCIKICVVHPEARLCTGCLRSIDEISQWAKMGHAARAAVIDTLPERRATLYKRRGGRAARLARDP